MYLLRTCTMRFAFALFAVTLFAPLLLADDGAHYQQTNLVSDVSGLAAHTDADLANPFGLTRGPATPWWVSDEGTGFSTLYNANGIKQGLRITVPPPSASPAGTRDDRCDRRRQLVESDLYGPNLRDVQWRDITVCRESQDWRDRCF